MKCVDASVVWGVFIVGNGRVILVHRTSCIVIRAKIGQDRSGCLMMYAGAMCASPFRSVSMTSFSLVKGAPKVLKHLVT